MSDRRWILDETKFGECRTLQDLILCNQQTIYYKMLEIEKKIKITGL